MLSFSHFVFLLPSSASKAIEMTREACGHHSPLTTEEGLTSKLLFILLTNCAQAAKVSVGEKLFTGLFLVLSQQNMRLFSHRKLCFFASFADKTVCLLSGTKQTCRLFFSASIASFSVSLLPDTVVMTTPSGSHGVWLTFFIINVYFPTIFTYDLFVIICLLMAKGNFI